MDAFHIRTHGLRDARSVARAEGAASAVPGVIAVMAVKALNVTSVLYEPLAVDRETVAEAIRHAGFSAEVMTFSEKSLAAEAHRAA
jgi:hypothetical protein